MAKMDTNRSSSIFSVPHIAQIRRNTAIPGIPSLYAVWPGQDIPGIADLLYRQAQEDRNHLLKIIAHHLRRETKQQLLNITAFKI